MSSTPVSFSTLDRVGAAHDGEIVPVSAGELILPDELVQPGQVHERSGSAGPTRRGAIGS